MDEFETLWMHNRNKVAKAAARKAYPRARKKVDSVQVIIDGLERYYKNKPAWQADCHLATFLNGERWLDEYAPAKGSLDVEAFKRDWEYRQRQQWADDVRCPPRSNGKAEP